MRRGAKFYAQVPLVHKWAFLPRAKRPVQMAILRLNGVSVIRAFFVFAGGMSF